MTLEKQTRATVDVRRLPGLTPYAEAWDLQKDLVRLRKNDEIPDTFILCEHPPVFTVGRAAKDAGNLGAGEDYLRALGAEVFWSDRGGEATLSCASGSATPTPTSANSKGFSSGCCQTTGWRAGTILNIRAYGWGRTRSPPSA